MRKPIPTNLILGFLGVGKTTSILSLLKRKPAAENWAVLVNEFGEVGIDGALLRQQGVSIREVPGGCLCCVAGVPMQIGLNLLISRSKPDRLLIEPSGLGHPAQVLAMLTSDTYAGVLDVRAAIGLVDARHLDNPRYLEHETFQDQANLADVLVGAKADQYEDSHRQRFVDWLQGFQPAKAASGFTSFGELPLAWLDLLRNPQRMAAHPEAHRGQVASAVLPAISLGERSKTADFPEGQDWLRQENQGQGRFSCGWVFKPGTCFEFNALFGLCSGVAFERLKAVMLTERGWIILNSADGVLTVNEVPEAQDSRLEVIAGAQEDWNEFEHWLLAARRASD